MHARRAVENTGITDDEVVRQMSIGSAFLDLPLDEKRKHPCNFAEGKFFGYREGVRIMGDSGVVDNSEACVLSSLRLLASTRACARLTCLVHTDCVCPR